MTGKRAESLLEMMLFIEMFTLTRAWNDLTDEELLWEPTTDCWTVRPVDQIQTADPFVVGDWAADFDHGQAAVAHEEPLTSIAWLFWHVGSQPGRTAQLDFLGGDHEAESGWTSPYLASHPIFRTADEAVDAMRAGWQELQAALRATTDERLEEQTRFWGYGGPGPIGTGAQIVASTLNEISHHATQIGVLRDFYRVRGGVSVEQLVH